MWWSRATCILLLGAVLAGCGYKPLYRQDGASSVVPQFSQIIIAQPEDRASQILRNTLLDYLTPLGTPERPRYRLEYRITDSVDSVFVTRQEEITRNNLVVSVAYILRDYEKGNALFSMSTTSYASYNLTRADYADLVAEKNAMERGLRDSADQLRVRLGNYFDRWQHERKILNQQPEQQEQQQQPGRR